MNHTKDNNTLKSKKNKLLTEQDRYKVEALLKVHISNKEIAEQLGKSDRTIRREIQRGTIILLNSDLTKRKEYCADVAHRKYLDNATNKGSGLKMGNDHKLAKYIEGKIMNEGQSPNVGSSKVV